MTGLLTVATLLLAAVAAAGLGGGGSAALDVPNSFAPLTLGLLALTTATLLARRSGPRWPLLAGLAGIVAAGAQVAPELVRPLPVAPHNAHAPLRLLTMNVWKRNVDPAGTVAAIRAAHADVVLLQETDGTVAPLIADLAPSYPFRTRCARRCGLFILSRRPITSSGWRLRDGDGRQVGPPLVWATTLAPDGRPVTAITLHYDWPLPGRGQAERRAEVAAALARLDCHALLLGGDMNLTPWTFAMRAQDRALAPMIRQTRALWSWPARYPGARAFPLPLLPIDQVYAGPAWRQVAAERLPRLGSDHYGLLVTLAR